MGHRWSNSPVQDIHFGWPVNVFLFSPFPVCFAYFYFSQKVLSVIIFICSFIFPPPLGTKDMADHFSLTRPFIPTIKNIKLKP